jgi:glutathione S-transferase
MPEFIVHTIPGSPFTRAVLVALEEKGAPYRVAPIAPGGLKSEPHISRHAFGRMPVLEHSGFMLYETQAILRYLDRILPSPALTPADPKGAARMDQVMNVSDWYLFQGVGNVIAFQRIVKPVLMGGIADEAAIGACMPDAHRVFNELSRLLGGQDYFAGKAMTLADIAVAGQMDFMAATPEWAALTEAIPNLVAWLARMNARPSMQATTWEKVSAMAKAA